MPNRRAGVSSLFGGGAFLLFALVNLVTDHTRWLCILVILVGAITISLLILQVKKDPAKSALQPWISIRIVLFGIGVVLGVVCLLFDR